MQMAMESVIIKEPEIPANNLKAQTAIREAKEIKKAVWVMVPAGGPTESVVMELVALCSEGDVIIDGGNSNYRDTMSRGARLREKHLDTGNPSSCWSGKGNHLFVQLRKLQFAPGFHRSLL